MSFQGEKKMTAKVFLAVAMCVATSVSTKAQATPPYRINAMRAMLFYENSGKFSQDILADKNFALWNVIIGAGSAEGASHSTLVVVEVSGKAGSYETGRKIQFTATDAQGRTLVTRGVPTGIMSDAGKFFAAFWLYDTGCSPVTLTARIMGQRQPSAMTKKIPFACGE